MSEHMVSAVTQRREKVLTWYSAQSHCFKFLMLPVKVMRSGPRLMVKMKLMTAHSES